MTTVHIDGLSTPRRWFAVLALSLGVAASVLVNSVVNIALPTLSGALGVTASSAVWVANAYQIAVAVALLPIAALGERVGHLRVYSFGLATFMLASLACAAAPSFATLLPARALQGLGAAGIMAVNTALLRAVYPTAQLGRGVGLNGMVVAASAAAGPTLGGAILSLLSWPWLFLLFVALALVAMGIGQRSLVDAPRPPLTTRVDCVSVLLQALVIVSFIVGIGALGNADLRLFAIGLVALALVLGPVFLRRELRSSRPLLPLDLFRERLFALSFCASCLSFVAQMLALITLPFSLHQLGFGPERTGLLMTPWPLAVMVIAPVAGALSDRWSASMLGSAGLAMAALALALLALMPTDGVAAASVAWRVALCGVGFALFSAPNVRTLIAAAPTHRTGAAGAMIAISRQIGQTIGAALAGVLLAQFGGAAGSPGFALAAFIASAAAGLSLLRFRRLPRYR